MPRSAAARNRKYRARQRRGGVVLQVEADEHQLAEALILSSRLTEAAALDRTELERQAADVLRQWSAQWLPEK